MEETDIIKEKGNYEKENRKRKGGRGKSEEKKRKIKLQWQSCEKETERDRKREDKAETGEMKNWEKRERRIEWESSVIFEKYLWVFWSLSGILWWLWE